MSGRSKTKKLQSATEYLLTYGWAFLIFGIVLASLYLFVFAPQTIASSSCTFSSGPYCQGLVLGTSGAVSKIAVLLTNTQSFPIYLPRLMINISGTTPITTPCTPSLALAGGAIICNATITPAVPQSSLASGQFILSYIPCPGANIATCSSNTRQSFPGSFTTHASPLLSPTTITLTLSAQNSTQVALAATLDKLTANVKLLGYNLASATVNFTSNSLNAVPNPAITTSDGNGNAYSYISTSQTGSVLVSASYANVIANTIISFTAPVCYTLSAPSISGATGNILTIDGVGYISLPQTFCYGKGTSHTYSFATTVPGGTGVQYVFNYATGCGASAQSGTLSGSVNCTLSGNYLTQYFLTTSASPGAGGAVTPSSGWYNAGASTTLGETPSAGYAFNGFTGTGSGSYTGTSTSPSVTLNNPITETGSFTSTSTSTTSTTSTTTTTTTSTIVAPQFDHISQTSVAASSSGGGVAPTLSTMITTTTSNELVLISYAIDGAGTGFSISDTSHLTWNVRYSNRPAYCFSQYLWWTVVPSPVTNDTITISSANSIAWDSIVAFSLLGANTVSPFDPNPSLPYTYRPVNPGDHATYIYSTSNPTDLVFAGAITECGTGSQSMPGWTNFAVPGYTFPAGSASYELSSNWYIKTNTVQTNSAATISGSDGGLTIDAVKGA